MLTLVFGTLLGAVLALAGGILADHWRSRRLARVAAELIAEELEAQKAVIRWVQESGGDDYFVIKVWEAERGNYVLGARRPNLAPVTDWYRAVYYSDAVDKNSAAEKLERCDRALEAVKREAATRFLQR